MSINLNPYVTTNAPGTFGVYSDGLVQGTAMADPATRYALAGGVLAGTETLPMWGGIAIQENIPGATTVLNNQALGGNVLRAAAFANITGFSVFDQNYSAVNTPQSPVPLVNNGGRVHFYRLGSGARVALQIDPALVNLDGTIITSQVSWDFTNQRLVAFATNALPVKILKIYTANCKTVAYNGTTGFATWNTSGACALVEI